jgi:hypothetical protein
MPLSPGVERNHLHTRTVTCQGFERADGLWDIEGHITDVKTYGFTNEHRGRLEPGTPLHDMWVRITVDDRLEIQAIEAVTDGAPFAVCPGIVGNFQRLVGLRISSGFTAAVKERVGGVEGCTHLVELMGPVATTAFQTISPLLMKRLSEKRKKAAAAGEAPPPSPFKRPPTLDTCHAFRSDGPLVQRLMPDHYTGS